MNWWTTPSLKNGKTLHPEQTQRAARAIQAGIRDRTGGMHFILDRWGKGWVGAAEIVGKGVKPQFPTIPDDGPHAHDGDRPWRASLSSAHPRYVTRAEGHAGPVTQGFNPDWVPYRLASVRQHRPSEVSVRGIENLQTSRDGWLAAPGP